MRRGKKIPPPSQVQIYLKGKINLHESSYVFYSEKFIEYKLRQIILYKDSNLVIHSIILFFSLPNFIFFRQTKNAKKNSFSKTIWR